ncbi:MAG: sulfurtransferase TusA family protein [Planctomycetota bacterium]
MSGETVDIRGEPCGMPVLRVERLLRERSDGRPFTVLGDREDTLEQLGFLAARHGWTCEVVREGASLWRAEFRPA